MSSHSAASYSHKDHSARSDRRTVNPQDHQDRAPTKYEVRYEKREYSSSRIRDDDKRRERNEYREHPYSKPSSSSSYPSTTKKEESYQWGKQSETEVKSKATEPVKPNFKRSGLLAAQARTTDTGTVLKYSPPEDARIPALKWRLFPFKGEEAMDPIPVYEKNWYLIGRDRDIVDIPIDHQTCSLQHAAIVHLQKQEKDPETGLKVFKVYPNLIDLESRNGTFINDIKCDSARYYRLLEGDCIKFGGSSREYVLLNDKSKK